jgi:hypothetical protein
VLKTVTRPAVLGFERDVARIHLRTVDAFDSAKEQTQLAGTDLKKLLDAQHARELADQRKTVKAALGGVEDAIGAVRPYLKGPSSGEAKGILIALNKAAGKFRKALKKGSKGLPSLLTVSPYSAKAPRRVKVIPPPPPVKLPTASVRTITTTTIKCIGKFESPNPIKVSGTLTPAQAGSEVRVSYTFGAAAPVVVTTTTDATGSWAVEYKPSPTDTGSWTVSASFAGDSSRTGSASPPCAIAYL